MKQIKWLQKVVPGLDGDMSFFGDMLTLERHKKLNFSNVNVFVVHVSTSNAKNVSTTSGATAQEPAEAQGVKANGVKNIKLTSPSPSNVSSSKKANGFSPTGTNTKKTSERNNAYELSQTLPNKMIEPSSSTVNEDNTIKAKSTSLTKTPTKPKRRGAINKASPSPSPSKITVSKIKGAAPISDTKEPAECVQQSQTASNNINLNATPVTNDNTSTHQSSILTLQSNPHTSQLHQQVTQQTQDQSRDQQTRERKVQYIYKQGGQTVIIDYPMTEDTLARLKPLPIIQQGQQQHQQIRLPIVLTNSTGGGSPQKIFAQRSTTVASASNQNATTIVLPTTPPKIILSAPQSPSVDSLANSLISQIQTPLNPTGGLSPSSQPQAQRLNQQLSASPSSAKFLPKFQFAFGGSRITKQVSSGAAVTQQNLTTSEANVKAENSNIVGTSSNNGNQQLVMKQVTLPLASAPHPQVLGAGGHVIQLQKSQSDVMNGKIILTQSSPQAQQIKQETQSPQQRRCIVQAVPGIGGGVTISKPQPTQINAIIQKLTPVTTVQQQLATRSRTSVAVLPQGTSASVLTQGAVSNSLSVSSTPTTPTSSPTSASNNQVDLIRQLNMARSQGLVILQQWGDKQVLVHKATGRWIMRQGNRLVTVPPQALGITPLGVSPPGGSINVSQKQTAAIIASGSPTKPQWIQANVGERSSPQSQGTPTGSPLKPTSQLLARLTSVATVGKQDSNQMTLSNSKSSIMSSSTMEQLAEFDSILESKFKSLSPPPPVALNESTKETTTSIKSITPIKIDSNNHSSATQSLSRTHSSSTSGPTFVILQPANTASKSSSTVVVTSATSTSSSVQNKSAFDSQNIQAEKMSSASSTSSRGSSNRSPSPVASIASTKHCSNNGIRLLSTSAPSSPAKHTSSTTPVAPLNQSCSSASASPASSTGSSSVATNSFMKPPPKAQEDPDTLKRIQQILDDYNEQIRNSPDLQNRPAPRRRTTGTGDVVRVSNTTTSSSSNTYSVSTPENNASPVMSPISANAINGNNPTTPKKKRNVGSNNKCESDTETSSIVQISPANLVEPGQILGSQKVISKTSSINESQLSSPVAPPPNLKPVVRQIMVPPSLAASLQASGRQLMVVTGPGGKKMVALKPLIVSQSNGSMNNGNSPIRIQTPSLNAAKSSSASIAVGPPGSSVAIEADDYHNGLSTEEEEDEGNGSSVNLGRPSQSDSPSSVVSSQSIVLTSGNPQSATSGSPMSSNNQSLPASPLGVRPSEATMGIPSKLDTADSPQPMSMGLEMPLDTQSMGIPIEMTPGQIMEAEMSAGGSFLDDEVVSASTSMNMNEFFTPTRHHSPPHHLRSARCSLGSDHETLSHAEQETLPENVFNHDFLSDGVPSPKLIENQHSITKSTSLLDSLESEMESVKDKIGTDFSLDGIVCSLSDTNKTDKEIFVKEYTKSGTDVKGHDVKGEVENTNKEAIVIFNNNQTQSPIQENNSTKTSTRQKRNLSATDNDSKSDSESPLPKRTRLRKQVQHDDLIPTQQVNPSSIRTRQRSSLMNKNKQEQPENIEDTESNQKLDHDEEEEDNDSLFNDGMANTSSISFLTTPFAGITTTASSMSSAVGDFDL